MDFTFKQILHFLEDKSPMFLCNLLSQNYYNEYYFEFDLKNSVYDFIKYFYNMHYTGRSIPDKLIESISEKFSFDFPMVVTCIYLIENKDQGQFLELCINELDKLYSYIQQTHNINYSIKNRSIYEFNDISKSEILFTLGFINDRIIDLKNLTYETEDKKIIIDDLTNIVVDKMDEFIKKKTEVSPFVNVELVDYFELMNLINESGDTFEYELKNNDMIPLSNSEIHELILEASIRIKNKYWNNN